MNIIFIKPLRRVEDLQLLKKEDTTFRIVKSSMCGHTKVQLGGLKKG